MIEIHCHSCDQPLVVQFVVQDEVVTVTTSAINQCSCQYTPEDLMDILSDAYEHEVTP